MIEVYKPERFRSRMRKKHVDIQIKSFERILLHKRIASNCGVSIDIRMLAAAAYRYEVAYFESIGGVMPTCKN